MQIFEAMDVFYGKFMYDQAEQEVQSDLGSTLTYTGIKKKKKNRKCREFSRFRTTFSIVFLHRVIKVLICFGKGLDICRNLHDRRCLIP